ncbi:MAG: replication-relaxation family protein [Patescibacteria group bacterium]
MQTISKATVKYRRPLNTEQVSVLNWLYNVRFSTCQQVGSYLRRDSLNVIYTKMRILEEQGFISKRYDKSYKLPARPAEYYLTPKGARKLEELKPKSTNAWAIRSLYKNKRVSQDFLDHCLKVTETILQLKSLYGDKLSVYTKSYMVQYNNYPTWTPDLYLTLPVSGQEQPHGYFLDIWDSTKPFFVSIRKASNYLKFSESGDWLEDTDFPAVLAICETDRTQKKLNRHMKRMLDEYGVYEVVCATTTCEQFVAATKPTEKLWLKVDPYDDPIKETLKSLFVTP